MNLPLRLRRLLRRPDPYADALRRELGNAAGSVKIPDREPRFTEKTAAESTLFWSLEQRRDG